MDKLFNANISHAFYYPTDIFESGEKFSSVVKSKFPSATEYSPTADFSQPYIRDMQTVQRFLHGGAHTYEVKRFFLEDFAPYLNSSEFTSWCVMLSFFHEAGVMSISFHYGIENVTSDQLIVLRQSGAHRALRFPTGERSCSEIAETICGAILGDCTSAEQSYLCEITKFGNYDSVELIRKNEANLLYGLLTGDEGYAFVPQDLASSRLEYAWGSRSFIHIFAFGPAFIFLNLLNSPAHTEYLAHQEKFGTAAYGGCDDYFKLGSCPFSVNHGILFSVEFVMVLKTLIDDVISYQGDFGSRIKGPFNARIRATRAFRKKIIMVLEKTENIAISEMGELNTVLLESQHIAPIIDRVKYLLELLEGDLDLMYSERNNTLVTLLTVIGLIFAAAQIILVFI